MQMVHRISLKWWLKYESTVKSPIGLSGDNGHVAINVLIHLLVSRGETI